MAQWVDVLVEKPDDPSLIPGTHVLGESWLQQVVIHMWVDTR